MTSTNGRETTATKIPTALSEIGWHNLTDEWAGGSCPETLRGLRKPNQEEKKSMTDQEIIDMFDSTNITLANLAMRSGRTVAELKKLLMS